MKITEVLIIYMIAHLLGDYYLQSEHLAATKTSKVGAFVLHVFLYALPFGLSWFIALPFWPVLVIITIGHALVDFIKIRLSKKIEKSKGERLQKSLLFNKPFLFLADQLLHIAIILAAVLIWPSFSLQAWVPSNIISVLRWVLVLLAIWTPASVSFEELFRKFRPQRIIQKGVGQKSEAGQIVEKTGPVETVEGAGRWIGIFERTITVLSISQGQYSALAVIIAAKSLARFKLISDDQRFAEYYLIGTLYSILFALLAYLLVFKLLV